MKQENPWKQYFNSTMKNDLEEEEEYFEEEEEMGNELEIHEVNEQNQWTNWAGF